MPKKCPVPDDVRNSLPNEVARAVDLALTRFPIPDPISIQDVKGFATAIQDAGASLGSTIKLNVARNAAARRMVGRSWQVAEHTLPKAAAPFSISLQVFGGQHRPQVFPIASIGEMGECSIREVLQQLAGSRGAVVDIERSPYSLKLTGTAFDRPSFVIECRCPMTPADQVHFTCRMVEVLIDRAPTILVNNAFLPSNPKRKPHTQAFFQLNAVQSPYRTGRLVGELELAEQFCRLRVNGLGGRGIETAVSGIGPINVQAGFRTHDQPFPRDYAPVTDAQLTTLVSRYMRWRDAVGDQIADLITTLKERQRVTPLAAAQMPQDVGQAAIGVKVPALLPMTMALGTGFLDTTIDRGHLAKLSTCVRQATLPLVAEHVKAMKSKLDSGRPGIVAWLNTNQHASTWPVPRQMMGMSADHEVAALGYWEHSHEVVGAAGRYSALEYSARLVDVDLTNFLKANSIKTSIPCPVCSLPAGVTVTMVPTETSLGVWSLACESCGHNEAVNNAPDKSFTASAPALTCACTACVARGALLLENYGETAKQFPALMDKALVDAAERFISGAPGWALAPDKTAHFGEEQAGRYFESPVAAAGNAAPSSLYRLLPEEVRGQLRNGGSISALLERDQGFERELSYCALPAFDGSAGWEHTYSTMRAGFDPKNFQSFRDWATSALAFALGGTLVLPMLVTIREPSRHDTPA